MARTLRIEHPGAIHQVMNRGDRRAAMFRDDAGRARFPATPAGAGGKAGPSSPKPKSDPVPHPFMNHEPIEPKPAADGGGGPLRGRASIKKRHICKYQELTPLPLAITLTRPFRISESKVNKLKPSSLA